MKTHYVYELYNLLGTIEYVGHTINAKSRLYSHTKAKPGNGCGKFYGRTDISMNIVKGFDNRKDAFQYQCQLQEQYGLETDKYKCGMAFRNKTRLPFSDEHKHNIGKHHKGKVISDEHKQKITEASKHRIRKPHSEETKQKLREAAIRQWNTNKV
jgi:predicted GIY-YIG superfamily endonuclease